MPSAVALPPTNNRLDKDQRSRLLRSARKLEALLGTTPQLLDFEEDDDGDVDEGLPVRISPKRQGIYGSTSPLKAFSSPSSSSVNSLDSSSDQHLHETDYVFLNKGDAAGHWEGLPSSPSSSRSVSPVSGRSSSKARARASNSKAAHSGLPPPPLTASQPLSRPLLLRLRALPANRLNRPNSTISIVEASGITTPKAAPPPVPIVQAPAKLLTPFERRKLKVDSVLGPLSPINQSHFHSHSISIADSPSSPMAFPESPDDVVELGLTDRDKRRKMAKLQRTLGENIPPELVFGALPSSTTTEKKTRRRSYSLSLLNSRSPGMEFFSVSSEYLEPKEKKDKGKGKAKATRPLPSLPNRETSGPTPKRAIRPLPPTPSRLDSVAPFITQTKTVYRSPSISSVLPSTLTRTPSRGFSIRKPKRRPRSLTLGTTSAIVTAEKAISKAKKRTMTDDKANNKPVMEPDATVSLRHRGTVSLDEERSEMMMDVSRKKEKMPLRAARSCERSDSTRLIRSSRRWVDHGLDGDGAPPFATSNTAITSDTTRGRCIGKGSAKEVWRRKEKEWSGEWNVKDMDEVTKALRELKAR